MKFIFNLADSPLYQIMFQFYSCWKHYLVIINRLFLLYLMDIASYRRLATYQPIISIFGNQLAKFQLVLYL